MREKGSVERAGERRVLSVDFSETERRGSLGRLARNLSWGPIPFLIFLQPQNDTRRVPKRALRFAFQRGYESHVFLLGDRLMITKDEKT